LKTFVGGNFLRKSHAIALCIMLAVLAIVLDATAVETAGHIEAMARARGASGSYAPDFTLRMMGGGEFRLADNIGKKVIVLNFFATWCGPCKREMPELSAYYDKHRDEPFVMIGLDADEKEAKVEKFIAKYGVTFPVGIDDDNAISDSYGVRSLPTTVLIGADGTVKLFEVGPVRDADKSFEVHVEESLQLISTGRAINKETYLEKLRRQSERGEAEQPVHVASSGLR
jgi:peroxiredoxin